MVISRALSSIGWLVWGLHGLKLSQCVVVHWDAGSMCARQRVHALGASPKFGNVPGTNCNFDGALLRNRQDNWTILVAAMPFLSGCVTVCHFMGTPSICCWHCHWLLEPVLILAYYTKATLCHWHAFGFMEAAMCSA